PLRGQDRWRSRDLESGPAIVFYEMTQACDLVCLHCRASAQCQPHPHELRHTESLQLVDQLMEFEDPPMLVLTGGDPFKRADLLDIVEYAVGLGIEVSVTPSATPLATRDAIRQLADAGVSRLAVSIDGADATTHDRHRGVPGSFARSLQMLDDAHDAGLATQVNTTLMPSNLHQIDQLAELLATRHIVLWSVFFLVPVGRALTGPRLSPEECEEAFDLLWQQAQRRRYMIKTTEAPHYRRYVLQNRRAASPHKPVASPLGLNDGKGILFVSHTGQIFPSGFLPIVCGQFPVDTLKAVYQQSPLFLRLRDADRLEGKCGLCEFKRICGGSRARAYALTGNPFAEEPDCIYQPRPARVTPAGVDAAGSVFPPAAARADTRIG
ncbi:MAG: radical SAM protein, partial [Pirellulaceae bacterium]